MFKEITKKGSCKSLILEIFVPSSFPEVILPIRFPCTQGAILLQVISSDFERVKYNFHLKCTNYSQRVSWECHEKTLPVHLAWQRNSMCSWSKMGSLRGVEEN